MRWSTVALLALLVAGCDPVYQATFTVTDARTGDPIAGASLALVDCGEGWGGGEASLTDGFGVVVLAGLGFSLPHCGLVIARPGYRSYESSFEAICGGPVDDCDRLREVAVMLAPIP